MHRTDEKVCGGEGLTHPAVLETHPCENCGKQTVVARISPCSEPDRLTGMWLRRMDEDSGIHSVGVLCVDCAFKLCDENKVALGFSGGKLGNLDLWEACVEVVSV